MRRLVALVALVALPVLGGCSFTFPDGWTRCARPGELFTVDHCIRDGVPQQGPPSPVTGPTAPAGRLP